MTFFVHFAHSLWTWLVSILYASKWVVLRLLAYISCVNCHLKSPENQDLLECLHHLLHSNFSLVSFSMYTEPWIPTEGLPTFRTFPWLLSRMNPLMFTERWLLSEGFPTFTAFKRFLSWMSFLVYLKWCLPGISFLTLSAFIGLLCWVSSLMYD